MARPTLVIANPAAGSDVDIGRLPELLSFLGEIAVRVTTRAGDATEIAREGVEGGADLIVVVGGDGTLNEVVNGLAPDFDRCELAIVPGGTGNDTARSLGIPLQTNQAIGLLRTASSASFDVMEVIADGVVSHAVNAVTGGFGGAVNEAMTEELKEWWGPLSYARAAASVIPELPVHEVSLALDEGSLQTLRVMSLVVANGRFAAKGICVAPGAEMADGRLAIHAVLESTPTELMLLAPSLLQCEIPQHEKYRHWKCRTAHVEVPAGLLVSVDGELVEVKELRCRVLPSSLRVRGVEPQQADPGA